MVGQSLLHRRLTFPVLVAVIAVAGCSTTSGSGAAAPSAAPSTGVPASPSSDAPRTIPASAFFDMPADMRRERREAEGAAAVPELCDQELAPSSGVLASAAVMNLYEQPDAPAGSVPHGVLYQTIRSYEGDGAAEFMERARNGLAACDSYQKNEYTVEVRTKALSGVADEALTVDLVRPQLDLPGNPTGGEQTNRIVVMRFGAVVTILYDSEYERSSSIPGLVDIFVDEAADAVRAWLD
ncbi:hypothetical protein [Paractinoplanes hotanensis]|uniref:Sensor domain-containing protein n=1 Tax=Paractinoplanes hotanensis TaxID=2906497 RepID=A0ABT0YCQ6_9ACTN|nr:hypothetical protein [Actinoplanes hotanensis]MCM4083831.1 hypothetical protein [Actinoplanes hotanensis]